MVEAVGAPMRERFGGASAACGVAWVVLSLAACAAPAAPAPEDDLEETNLLARARGIHLRVMALDTHVDIDEDFSSPASDPGQRGSRQVDLPKMDDGGLDAAFFIVYVGQTARTPENYLGAQELAQRKFDGIFQMTRTYQTQIALACRSSDVETIHAGGRRVALIGVENGYSIGKDLGRLQAYYDQCARYFGLVHNGHNDIADSASPSASLGDAPEEHGGLSAFGEAVVRELNRLGMMVDVSHASKQTMLEAIAQSTAPIIASHSGAAALVPHQRNLDDEQLLALKANGGVVQAVAYDSYVKARAPEKTSALSALAKEFGAAAALAALPPDRRAAYDARLAAIHAEWPRATVADFVDHIDYIVRTIGIDHVGIASDFDGGGGIDGWNDASQTFNVTLELVRRGYSEADIAKIWGGNLLRVWREVERLADERRPSGR